MVSALRQLLDAHDQVTEVALIGYSGGGVLAWLIAERIPEVTQLITIAANLDIDAWTQFHQYSPLSGSLNPALRAPLPQRILQLHLTGKQDRISPASLAKTVIATEDRHARVRALPANHRCCWEEFWPSVLREL